MQFSATLPTRFRQTAHRIGRTLVDGILPPRCLACGATVGEPHALPGLRGDGRRAARALRAMLGGDDVFRAAVV